MNFKENISNIIKSKSTLIWVDTKEYNRCTSEVNNISKELNKTLKIWDIDNGLHTYLDDDVDNINPLEYITDNVEDVILVLNDFHMLINEHKNWRELVNTINSNINNDNTIIIVSPIVKIPVEIEHYITVIEMGLPNIDDFINILNSYKALSEEDKKNIARNGLGLTAYQFNNAVNLSIITKGKIDIEYIYEQKKQLIEKNGLLKVYKSDKKLDDLIGMENMKDFTKSMIKSGNGRGILITGVPGVGKTEFAKRLGNETNRITITLDFGELMGSYVGETEKNTKEVFKIIDAVSPSIVFIDEIEKGLSGTNENGGDSVSKRQGGQFLKWLQDHNSDAYVVATANNVQNLPSEFLRSGRWDAIFFTDMPSKKSKRKIFEIYKNKYTLHEDFDIEAVDYTGAEIETLCKLSKSLNISLKEAAKFISPINKSMSVKIKELREFGNKKAINADLKIDKNNNEIFNL